MPSPKRDHRPLTLSRQSGRGWPSGSDGRVRAQRCNQTMPISYSTIVPWGRSYQEYIDMFSLTEEDLHRSILGCGDGPAAFNSIMRKKGRKTVSVDPIYQFSAEEIKQRIDETFEDVKQQTENNKDRFLWTRFKDVDHVCHTRMSAMKEFLADYDTGKKEKRYVPAELPVLPFSDKQFDIALSSHFLFLYSDNLSFDFHLQAIDEMLRVAREVRIFPLLDLNARESPCVTDVISYFKETGLSAEKITVGYEFQRGGNEMLRITNRLFV